MNFKQNIFRYLSGFLIVILFCLGFSYSSKILIYPNNTGDLVCGVEYDLDILLDTDGENVIASDIKFFLDNLDIISFTGMYGFDNIWYLGTGISTKGVNSGKIYHYINVHQNSFSNFVSGNNILIAKITVSPVLQKPNGNLRFYNIGSNDEDSNISVGIQHGIYGKPIAYTDSLLDTIDGYYTFTGCGYVCVDTDWTPQTNMICYPDTFTQTSNCGNTRISTGTKNCTPPTGGAGGGGTHVPKDYCPDGDFSHSYYDGECGEYHSSPDICGVNDSKHSTELKGAYLYSYMYGITTMCPIYDANLDGYLYRNHFAKMISEFAVNVLGKKPDVGKIGCEKYDDIENDTDELKGFMKMACELELMGLHADGKTPKSSFDPNQILTRAEFGTVFSRLLFEDKYNVKDENLIYKDQGYWYRSHLQALKDNNIMTQIDGDWPNTLELRGWVMLMMQRADNYGVFVGKIPVLNGVRALFN